MYVCVYTVQYVWVQRKEWNKNEILARAHSKPKVWVDETKATTTDATSITGCSRNIFVWIWIYLNGIKSTLILNSCIQHHRQYYCYRDCFIAVAVAVVRCMYHSFRVASIERHFYEKWTRSKMYPHTGTRRHSQTYTYIRTQLQHSYIQSRYFSPYTEIIRGKRM